MSTASNQPVVFTSYLGYDKSLSVDSAMGCNLGNTTILTSVPSSATTSKGSYLFKANGSTVLLNASGSDGDTQIVLSSCSSTSPPTNVLLADKTGTYSKKFETVGNAKNVVLEGDSIKFSGVDYKALVDLHTTQISNLAAVDVTELAKLSDLEAVDTAIKARLDIDEANILALQHKQPLIITVPLYHVASVYADSQQMIDYIPAAVSNVTPYSGWYFKNELNKKVNWYIQPDSGMTVGDIKGLMLNFYNVSATTGLGCPFFSVYTKTDALTPNAGSWYKSRKTFSVDYQSATTVSTSYALLADLKSLPYSPVAYGHTKVAAVGIAGNDKGTFADSEQILFFSVGTASNSAAGLFEFIAGKFTVLTASASNEFLFIQK
jgi:hypothetical protein